jgi:DNA polymerase III epsilon subunit-like protein
MKKFIVLDTETTGFKPGQIAQLSYLIFDENFKVLDKVNEFFMVDEMPEGASNIHGLTLDKLKLLSNGQVFEDVADRVYEDLMTCDRLIIHNAPFDMNFLTVEFDRIDTSLEIKDVFCTMKHFTEICKIPGSRGYKWPKLVESLKYVGVSDEVLMEKVKDIYQIEGISFHDARVDVVGLLILYYRGVKLELIKE